MQLSSILTIMSGVLATAGPVQHAKVMERNNGDVVESYIQVNEVIYYMNGVATSTSFDTTTIYTTLAATSTAATIASTKPAASITESGIAPAETVPGPGALKVGPVPPQSEAFINISLYHHNVHRANHSAPAMTWNQTIGNWAQTKANTCVFNEDGAPGSSDVGMNIAGGSYGSNKVVPNPSSMISGLWYNSEIENYPGYGNPSPPATPESFETWGHFTQVVWPESIQLGCGLTDCGDSWFGVCLYSPPGNILDHFNVVGSPLGMAPVYPNGQTSM